MIRVLVVDDHPALRAGVTGLLRCEPGLVPVAAAADAGEALEAARRTNPDVVLADYALAGDDGLTLCLALKSLPAPPQVLMYSAFAGEELAVAVRVAGGDGLIDKAATPRALSNALRDVSRGRGPMAAPTLAAHRWVAAQLAPHELAVFGMRVQGTSVTDIAQALRLEPHEAEARVGALLGRLRPIVDRSRTISAMETL